MSTGEICNVELTPNKFMIENSTQIHEGKSGVNTYYTSPKESKIERQIIKFLEDGKIIPSTSLCPYFCGTQERAATVGALHRLQSTQQIHS